MDMITARQRVQAIMKRTMRLLQTPRDLRVFFAVNLHKIDDDKQIVLVDETGKRYVLKNDYKVVGDTVELKIEWVVAPRIREVIKYLDGEIEVLESGPEPTYRARRTWAGETRESVEFRRQRSAATWIERDCALRGKAIGPAL